MRSTPFDRLRALAFAICAVCTLWLIAQNAFLLALLPQATWPSLIRGAAGLLHLVVTWGLPLVLVPLAFALGWVASRRSIVGTNGGAES
jgi:hypothetical protein